MDNSDYNSSACVYLVSRMESVESDVSRESGTRVATVVRSVPLASGSGCPPWLQLPKSVHHLP